MRGITTLFIMGTLVLAGACTERRNENTLDGSAVKKDGKVIPQKDGSIMGDTGIPPADNGTNPVADKNVTPPPDQSVATPDMAVYPPDLGPTKKCTSDSQCSGYDCSQGVCRRACYSSGHCASGYACNYVTAQCLKQVTCKDNKPCGTYACRTGSSGGYCYSYCYNDSYCSAGNVCKNSKCAPANACKTDAQCGGFTCNTVQGICRAYCSSNIPCASGYICDGNNKCQKQIGCKDDTPCKGYQCITTYNICRTTCSSTSSHCAKGYSCLSGQGICAKDITCKDDKPCKGYRCDTQKKICRTTCIPYLPNQCASGFSCYNFTCQPK